jgi:Gas vesicle synthesis protein GvpO.
MSDNTNDGDVTTQTAEMDSNETGQPSELADATDEMSNQSEQTDEESTQSTMGLLEAQRRAREVTAELLDYEFDGVIKVEMTGDNWRTVVEVVERNAVPDTQDIIGRYEITLDATGTLSGYELVERYRRGDMKEEL